MRNSGWWHGADCIPQTPHWALPLEAENLSSMVGTRAPEFDLQITRIPGEERRRATLADYRDRWLILIFYPRDFSLVCPTELTALSLRYEEFVKRDCDLLGISTDSIETHERWRGGRFAGRMAFTSPASTWRCGDCSSSIRMACSSIR
jgi:hypothetical protein